jgi:hypothetical protein
MNIALATILIVSIAGIFAVVAIFFIFHPANDNTPMPPAPGVASIYGAMSDAMAKYPVNKVVIALHKVSEYPPMYPSGPDAPVPVPDGCVIKTSSSEVNATSPLLSGILDRAAKSKGQDVRYQLTPAEFVPIAQLLCSTDPDPYGGGRTLVGDNEEWYSGGITTTDNGAKYYYFASIFFNAPEKSPYKTMDSGYKGPMPVHDRLKIYIFATSQFFDSRNNTLLSDIQKKVVYFTPVNEDPFLATPAGIINANNNYLVVPNGTDVYIDRELKKPDGTPVTQKDLSYYGNFGNGFTDGTIGIKYNYEYSQIPAIWFVVDAKQYAGIIDAHLKQIRAVINSDISRCMQYKEIHPELAQVLCH